MQPKNHPKMEQKQIAGKMDQIEQAPHLIPQTAGHLCLQTGFSHNGLRIQSTHGISGDIGDSVGHRLGSR